MNSSFQGPSTQEIETENLFSSPAPHFLLNNLNYFQNTNNSSQNPNYEDDLLESSNRQRMSLLDDLLSPEMGPVSNNYTVFDIYGNELHLQSNITPFDNNEDYEGQNTTESDLTDHHDHNKENNDPTLKITTPLKSKNPRRDQNCSRSSHVSSRSPLVDITPPMVRRTANRHTDSTFGVISKSLLRSY